MIRGRFYLLFTLAIVFCLLLVSGSAAVMAEDVLKVRNRLGHDINTMDPAHYTGTEYAKDLALYSKLMRFKPNSSELEMDAAEHIEISDDNLIIEFRLREGIQFHHGYGEMTAEDVKFSFERIIDPEVASEYATDWGALKEVEVTGRYTGRIIMTEPYAPLFVSTIPYTPGSIISKKAYEEKGERFATSPVGSGPYYWKEWIPGQKVVLERFEDFYGEKGDFQRIELYPMVEFEVAEMAFDRGDLNATPISLDSFPRYEADPNVEMHMLSTLRYHWLGFNHQKEPFDDIRVRKAVRYIVNVEDVIAGAYAGIPARANTILAPGILGYWEDAPEYQVDEDRARELLAEAGFPDGFQTTITTDSTTEHVNSAQIIQDQLRRIGIDARIEVVEAGAGFETIGRGDTEGFHYASFSAILDPGYWFEWFTTEQIGSWNYWKWSNEEFDELKELGDITVDPEEREQIYIRMQEIIDEEVACIWITHGASVYVTKPGIVPAFMAHYPQYHYWGLED